MNARLYAPILHRFLQVDNYIQDPTNTQNYNQYGYVLNNPLKYTDPSGNAFGDGKDCANCGGNNYPVYNPDKMQDNKALANGIQGWVDGWASARNFDEAGTAVGKAARDAGNFIGRNIRSLFGGKSSSSGPPPNRSSYANVNNQNSNINVNSSKGSLPCTGDCDGWLGTEYIGPTPTSTFYRRQTPVDMVDVAAQKHDAGYIFMGADGIVGATVDVRVIEYDKILVRDAKKVYNDYYNYGIDTQTRLPISFQTQLRAAGVITLFTPLIQLKQGLLNLRTTYQGFIFSKNQFFSTLYF